MFVDIIQVLEDFLNLIIYMIRELDKGSPLEPSAGWLRKRGSPDYPCYDLVMFFGDKQRSKHIGGDRSNAVISLKSRMYNKTLYKTLLQDKPVIEKMLRIARAGFRPFDPQSIDAQLKPAYVDSTGLVNKNPCFMSDADWKKSPYRHSSRPIDRSRAFVSCDGTWVRSKGEMIIYNMLVYLNVPFRYEEVITLLDENGRKVTRCPDFVIRRPDGTEVILEYLGMLSDPRYAQDNFEKFMLYWRNGYVLNETLFYVTDDVNGVLNSEVVMNLIKHNIMWK